MSDSVTWHDNGRGPRILLPIGGEDVVVTADRARWLRDQLSAVLDEIDKAEAKTPLDRLRELASVSPLSARAPQGDPYRTPPECDHGVTFDESAWRARQATYDGGVPARLVRELWPRLDGDCPKGCGFHGIAYASTMHFVAGDW